MVLGTARGERAQTEFSKLLRSPFVAEFERESGAGAALDVALRRSLRPNDPATPSTWMQAFAAWLECQRWPDDRPFDSAEFQAAGRFQELLQEFARLDVMAVQWSLEAQRPYGLLDNWLNLEAARASFEVYALESRQDVTVGGSTLQVRGDSVDRLSDGRALFIDYKTAGQISIADWTEVRLEQPQVLLYCLLDDYPAAAAAIAQINARRMVWHGLAAEDGLLPEVPALGHPTIASWKDLLAHWRQALRLLGDEIVQGRAATTPSNAACRHCEFPGLCRLWDYEGPGAATNPGDKRANRFAAVG